MDSAQKEINRYRTYEQGFNHYDEGWNAYIEGKPYVGASVSWRDGWRDAFASQATEKMK
jgi:hypothetical protein